MVGVLHLQACYSDGRMNKRPFAILGAGNAATALALLLAHHKREIRMYCIEPDVLEDINVRHSNTKYLPGVKLPSSVKAFANVAESVQHAEVVLLAVPSFALQEALTLAIPFLDKDVVIGSITKGLDETCLKPVAAVAASYLPKRLANRMCLIGGPAVAHELAHGQPAALLIAGPNKECTSKLAKLLHTTNVKAGISKDLVGVGYAMALKNVYAIALGMCDGLKYPMNSKALVTAIALEEMEHIIVAAGGKEETTLSLAGVGDLLVTGFSPHGRNRTYGERLVGADFKDPQKLGLLTVEGIAATKASLKLIKQLRVEAPLLRTVAKCLSSAHHFERPFMNYLKHLSLI
jgi:glycerol-3-phosphate dehydrogenase (NAD(P)+)